MVVLDTLLMLFVLTTLIMSAYWRNTGWYDEDDPWDDP